jgi:hypothetical protein
VHRNNQIESAMNQAKKNDLPISKRIVWPARGACAYYSSSSMQARIQIVVTAEHDDGGARRITPPR